MNETRIAAMADKIAAEETDASDQALANVDQAVDTIIAALQAIDENLPLVKAENVPQQAALDNAKETLNTGVKPYFADVVKSMSFFD